MIQLIIDKHLRWLKCVSCVLLALLASCGQQDDRGQKTSSSKPESSGGEGNGHGANPRSIHGAGQKSDFSELAKEFRLAQGSQKAMIFRQICSQCPPEQILKFLSENQGYVSASELADMEIIVALQRASDRQLISVCNEIADDVARGTIYRRVIADLFTDKGIDAIKESLKLIPSERLRGQFLTAIFQRKLEIQPFDNVMSLLSEAKSLLYLPMGQ